MFTCESKSRRFAFGAIFLFRTTFNLLILWRDRYRWNGQFAYECNGAFEVWISQFPKRSERKSYVCLCSLKNHRRAMRWNDKTRVKIILHSTMVEDGNRRTLEILIHHCPLRIGKRPCKQYQLPFITISNNWNDYYFSFSCYSHWMVDGWLNGESHALWMFVFRWEDDLMHSASNVSKATLFVHMIAYPH